MFYDEKQIRKVLNCEKCHKQFDIPFVLPCGNCVCNRCVVQFSTTNKCYFCSNHHGGGYPTCKPIQELLNQEPVDVENTHSAKLLKQNLKLIQSQINDLKFDSSNSIVVLQQHFASLRNDVQLAAENIIKNVNQNSSNLLNKLDETEQAYLLLLKRDNNTEFYAKFFKDINSIILFHDKWNSYLNGSSIDNNLIIQGNSSANFIKKILEKKRIQLNNFIFDNRMIRFKKSNAKMTENMIGLFKVKKRSNDISTDDELNWGTVLFEKS